MPALRPPVEGFRHMPPTARPDNPPPTVSERRKGVGGLSLSLMVCLENGSCGGVGDWEIEVSWPGSDAVPSQPAPAHVADIDDVTRLLLEGASIPLSAAQARTLAKTCISLAVAANLSGVGGLGPCDSGMPKLFPGSDTPETTAHIATALGANPLWLLLNRRKTPKRGTPAWYDQPSWTPNACTGRLGGMGRGVAFACDEYPFLSAAQGGPGAHVSLKPVPNAESWPQARGINGVFSCGVKVQDPFVVIPCRWHPVPCFFRPSMSVEASA